MSKLIEILSTQSMMVEESLNHKETSSRVYSQMPDGTQFKEKTMTVSLKKWNGVRNHVDSCISVSFLCFQLPSMPSSEQSCKHTY